MDKNPGDIFVYNDPVTDARHPFVVVSRCNEFEHDCCMLTKSARYEDNVLMKPKHFRVFDANNRKWLIQYKKSHFVSVGLVKDIDSMNVVKAGELTEAGLEFVKENKGTEPSIDWYQYKERSRLRRLHSASL